MVAGRGEENVRAMMSFMTPAGHAVHTVATAIWAGIGGGVIAIMLAREKGGSA